MSNLSLQTPTIKKEAEHLVDLLRYQRFYVTHSGIPLGLCISFTTFQLCDIRHVPPSF